MDYSGVVAVSTPSRVSTIDGIDIGRYAVTVTPPRKIPSQSSLACTDIPG
jgi:hypothetical protein